MQSSTNLHCLTLEQRQPTARPITENQSFPFLLHKSGESYIYVMAMQMLFILWMLAAVHA